MTTMLQAAQSPDQSMVAVVPPLSGGRALVQVYQLTASSSCQLQLTLTHSTTSSSETLHELMFCGNSAIVARLGTSQIIQWDLDRGVVAQSIEAKDEETFLGLSTTDDCFFALTRHGTKLVVHEYARASGKLQRKIKSGHWEGNEEGKGATTATICVSSSNVVVQTSPGVLRVMNSQTGKKIGKIKASKGAVTILNMTIVDGTLVTVQSSGAIVLYDLVKCEELAKIMHQVPQSGLVSDAMLQLVDDYLLVENAVFSKQGGGSSYEKVTTLKTNHPMVPFLTSAGSVMALVHQKRTGCQAHFVELTDDTLEQIDLDKVAATTAAETKPGATLETAATKRKASEPMILGPGQAGIEAAPPTKKPKAQDNDDDKDDDEDEPSTKDITIAERLKQLTEALDEEDEEEEEDEMDEDGGDTSAPSKPKFKPQRATTESLKELLSQALQSGDDSLLELALSVRDVKVISTTLKEVGSSHIETLLSKLTTRLA